MKRWLTTIGLLVLSLFIAGEIIGRYWGLTDLSLYQTDKDFEYIPQPNQNRLVYRNKYFTNKFSMRSEPIKEEDTCNVLFIGDSIIYGGNSTDQDSLATTILERKISYKLNKRVRVLNISAQSWGPDNGAAYIIKNGTFNAKLIILVYSSHDAHDNMTFKPLIGAPPYYNKNHFLAWQTLLEKASPIITNYLIKEKEKASLLIDNEKAFNPGFAYFNLISQQRHIPVILYLHSEIDELKKGRYNYKGQEIVNFCTRNHVSLIKGVEKEHEDLYMDEIHFNNKGQRFLAEIIYPIILRELH